MRPKFIQTAILLVGVGIFVESTTGFFYFSEDGLDVVWASKNLECWWFNGEYTENPIALACTR